MSWIGRSESHDSLHFRVLPPCDELRRFIRYYWVLKCPPDAPFVEEYLAPDGFEEIIYSYGAAFLRTEVESNTRSRSTLNGSYVVPCKTVGVSCSRLGPLNMVGIKLWPNSLHALLDHSMKDLKSSALPLRDLSCTTLSSLEDQLYEASSETSIKDCLDKVLKQVFRAHSADPLLEYSLRKIFRERGGATIDSILKGAGCHYRTLEKNFQRTVGLSPKSLAKVIRFKHVFDRLMSEQLGSGTWYEFGYYDQSHFTRDFKQFTGTSPRRFFQSRLVSTEVLRFCLNVDIHRLNEENKNWLMTGGIELSRCTPSLQPT